MEQLREYLAPEMEILLVDDDVITASGMGGGVSTEISDSWWD